jgi:hypothetical protein
MRYDGAMSTIARHTAFALACTSLAAVACGESSAVGGSSTDDESGDTESESDDSDQTTGTASCEIVEIADPALEQTIRDALEIPAGPIGGEELLALTSIHVEHGELDESGVLVKLHGLSGLECAENLEELTWENGVAFDFEGFAPLAGLSKLRILVLGGGPVVDLGPLAGLGQLEVLSLQNLDATDLTPLAGLTNLRTLELPGNQLTDIGPLAGLANLEELDLTSSASFDSAIVDISALAGLAKLRRLDLNGNEVVDLAPLAGLAKLQELVLQGNAVVDIEPITNLPALHSLDALGNPIVDVASLASLVQVHAINLSGAQITDLSGLVGCTWQTPTDCADIILTVNPLTEQTVAQDLPEICAANPSVAIWIGLGEAPFCNPAAACP